MWNILWKSVVCYLALIAALYLGYALMNWIEHGLIQPTFAMTFSLVYNYSMAVLHRIIFLLLGIGYARALYVLFRQHKRCTLIMALNGVIAAAGSIPLALVLPNVQWIPSYFVMSTYPISATTAGLLAIVAAFVFRRWDQAAVRRQAGVTKITD